MPQLNCVYMYKNPCVRRISMYRKSMTMNLPNLHYLDERPIYDAERLTADAFKRGGKEEEERVRQEYAANKKRKDKENTEYGLNLEEDSREERKRQFKKMMSDLKESKSNDLLSQHRELKQKWKNEENG